MRERFVSKRRPKSNSCRTQLGQLVGAPDVVLLVIVAVPLLALLVNFGIVMYYKLKLGCATKVGVQVLTTIQGATISDAEKAVSDACQAMSLGTPTPVSNPGSATIDGQPALTITEKITVPLFGSELRIFPSSFTISDTAVGLDRSGNYIGGVAVRCAYSSPSGSAAGGPSGPGAPLVWIPIETSSKVPPSTGWWFMNWWQGGSTSGGCGNNPMSAPALGYAVKAIPSSAGLIPYPVGPLHPGQDSSPCYSITSW